jgi:hypothetical protein
VSRKTCITPSPINEQWRETQKCNSRSIWQYSAALGFEDLIPVFLFCDAPLLMRPRVGKALPANGSSPWGVGLPPGLDETTAATKKCNPTWQSPAPRSCKNAPLNNSILDCLDHYMPRSSRRLPQSEPKFLAPLFYDQLGIKTNLNMPENWEYHKNVIEELYLTRGCTLEEVRKIMKTRHGFIAA